LAQALPLFLEENSDRGELPHAPDAAMDILNNHPDLDQPISAADGAARHEA
jgi:predicted Zn-dependent protease